jgi:hypothetical protein
MDLFTYDHEELARRIQTGLDRMTVNYLRAHGARFVRDELDYHGFEHIDLELMSDGHRLTVRQTGRPKDSSPDAPPDVADAVSTFESTFDEQPASTVSAAMIAQWLALLPEGEYREERVKPQVDPANPFLSDIEERQQDEPVNPFLTKGSKVQPASNPFAPDDSDKKRRAAFEWLAGDEEH